MLPRMPWHGLHSGWLRPRHYYRICIVCLSVCLSVCVCLYHYPYWVLHVFNTSPHFATRQSVVCLSVCVVSAKALNANRYKNYWRLINVFLAATLVGWTLKLQPSTERFFNLNEIWHVGRRRRVMHDGMQYDPIQGQGHEPLKVGNSAIFKGYLLLHL